MTKIMSEKVQASLEIIKHGCIDVLVENELIDKLIRSEKTGIPLRVKLGMDPTAPDLHLGHTVVLRKLRQLQDLGHQVIFLVGNFTAMIGDPTGRNTTRPALHPYQIDDNAKTYIKQVGKILDMTKTEFQFNSVWCDKLTSRDMIELTSKYTVARMMERDDFTKRFKNNIPISIHEFVYPLMQGYDSVVLDSDIEIGGTDQTFNLLVGRELQKSYGKEQQCIITLPLLIGLDGVDKMSKSKGNFIAIMDPPIDMFGKLMSISDTLMWNYYDLVSSYTTSEINSLKISVSNGTISPRDVKVQLAINITTMYHSEKDALIASNDFMHRARGGIPKDILELTLPGAPMRLTQLLKLSNLCVSSTDAGRMIDQNSVKIDSVLITDKTLMIESGTATYQVGKRKFTRITLTD